MTEEFYKKYRDKEGEIIEIGDTVYGEDGRAWWVKEVCYGFDCKYPIVGELRVPIEELNVVEFCTPTTKRLRPKWLTHHCTSWEQAFRDLLAAARGSLMVLENSDATEQNKTVLQTHTKLEKAIERAEGEKNRLVKRRKK